MKHTNFSKILLVACVCSIVCINTTAVYAQTEQTATVQKPSNGITSVQKLNPTTVELRFQDKETLTLDFYGPNIFRAFLDPTGGVQRNPEATPEAEILVQQPRRCPGIVSVQDAESAILVSTASVALRIEKSTGCIEMNHAQAAQPITQLTGIRFDEKKMQVYFNAQEKEYFYGGGVQNGRFSHRGHIIEIVNTNNWTDGGVASPTPFFWSTAGYGVLFHTFAPGKYDFCATQPNSVKLQHETNYADFFVMVNDNPVALLNDFYQLTGQPVLLPKFGFYEGHLNAYNRDYWKETEQGGILFEDGKRYKESQKDTKGIKESLNGENDNYQFSARAALDRYLNNDMPLGWFLPNDGYGAGYGQTETLDGNIENLKSFGEYARSKGVEIGLWTQSDLHPKEGVEPLLQRDIIKEVRDAGVRVLKTDVAWVGAGYSFGLNGVAYVGEVMPYYGQDARPFIISLDGWAGTQRYAGIWSGDQTGGEWEYIRFHIPTYIGSGLSGQPNITSDMDGIFGGKNLPVNVRDFQWKTFTPMQLNMDGWGANPKYPQALGEPATSLNRAYLKLKSILMPYTYTIAHEAVAGKPMMRAMFLDEPNDYTHGIATRYQFIFGPALLVAPIYQATRSDSIGNDIRNNIYLPRGDWEDAFTGTYYKGGCILNEFDAPLWKLPVFVKRGSIIPFTAAHNVPRDASKSQRSYYVIPTTDTNVHTFTEYDDDGTTQAYLFNQATTTTLTQQRTSKGKLTITIAPTRGSFEGMTKRKATTLLIRTDAPTEDVTVKVGKETIREQFEYMSEGTSLFAEYLPKEAHHKMGLLRIDIDTIDITQDSLTVIVRGIKLNTANNLLTKTGSLTTPIITDTLCEAYKITPSWQAQEDADYYEIHFKGQTFSTIRSTSFTLEDLIPDKEYTLQLRAVNAEGTSPWTTLHAKTDPDPLRFAIRGAKGTTSCANQDGQEIKHLFDFDETTMWHTDWYLKATPFSIEIDLGSVNVLDKFEYLPRQDAGNGTLLRGSVTYSMDRHNQSQAGTFSWKRDGSAKTFTFDTKPTARYITITVDSAAGNFGSGHEIYIFRVGGSESYIPGDINHDQRVDENDFTSFMNYTGLRKGDSDFEGYISKGDLNCNGLIDAYDISNVGIVLESGVSSKEISPLNGNISVTTDKKHVKAGEEVILTLHGKDLVSLNAFSCAIPYDATLWEYVSIDALGTKEMRNLTYDRLHTNGQKALYPTFVNCGEHPYIEGSGEIVKIHFKAKRATTANFQPQDAILVDKYLHFSTPF